MNRENYYPAKILLFGEYAIVRGGAALALPCWRFKGRWVSTENEREADVFRRHIPDLFAHLESLQLEEKILAPLDLDTFWDDLEKGLYFQSSIPIGYGMGSSGALCAAIYDRYATDKIDPDLPGGMSKLQQALAQYEDFFHGASSGLDPLVCYLKHAVKVVNRAAEKIKMPAALRRTDQGFWLIDSGHSRSTEHLVAAFNQQCTQQSFLNKLEQLSVLNELAIGHYLKGERSTLMPVMHQISEWQFKYFDSMIPPTIRSLWLHSLNSQNFKIKLCGAGGGGFMLGFGRPDVAVQEFDRIPLDI